MTARESGTRTMAVAIGVALVCSAMVTAAVQWLRPIQSAHALVERNRAIVSVAGLAAPDSTDQEVTAAYLTLDAGVWDRERRAIDALTDARSYDHWDAGAPLAADGRPALVPFYRVAGGATAAPTTHVVLPVAGSGMWSTVYGYVGLARDLDTITAVVFHRHGDTPGIGDRIQDPAWLATWRGKRVYDGSGAVRFEVSAPGRGDPAHHVDLITGASVTSQKVGELVAQWMGEQGHAPLLRHLHEREAAERESPR